MRLCIVLCLALAACHDSPRKNPFDPELTPSVQDLRVRVDSLQGHTVLNWPPYAGAQPFAEYRVQRTLQGMSGTILVERIPQQQISTYTDTTTAPDQDYLYRIDVVNQAGAVFAGAEVPAGAYRIGGVELRQVQADELTGHIVLDWQPYRGPDFERYVIWRQEGGLQPLEMGQATAGTTTWTDTLAQPYQDYLYWIALHAGGKIKESRQQPSGYNLPIFGFLDLTMDSFAATAHLQWPPYEGPGFVAYRVQRRSGNLAEITVATIAQIDQSTYVDSSLDGYTQYDYRLCADTVWGAETCSPSRRDLFYDLEAEIELPALGSEAVQATALALDESDQLYVAATVISATTATIMKHGIKVKWPGSQTYRSYFTDHRPHINSPLYIAAGLDRLWVVFAAEVDENAEITQLVVGAIDENGLVWEQIIAAEDTFPVGLSLQPDIGLGGQLLVADNNAVFYPFDLDGLRATDNETLGGQLRSRVALPLRHLIWSTGPAITNPLGQLFFLAPQRTVNLVLGSTPLFLGNNLRFGGTSFQYDEGVGLSNGQTLNPLVLAYDQARNRLVVIDNQARLQIFTGDEGVPQGDRFITQWGQWGLEPGQFYPSPPTVLSAVVDRSSRIIVADGRGDVGRLQIFAP
ncbi:MAG: hypothetical protein GKR89_27125 [Candidatus Latescibacteria bacterium]|nr:hypothetical protein [Candidatus Latescibacterota bacterium]